MTAPTSGRAFVTGRLWAQTAVLVGLVFGYCATHDLTRWKGDWWWGYNHLSQAFPIVIVVLAVAAAWDAGSADNGIQSWSARVPDARWKVPASMMGKTLAVAIALQLVATLWLAVITVANRGELPPTALAVIGCHTAMLVFATMVGLVLGSRVPSIFAAIAAVSLVTAMLFFAPPFGARVLEFPGTGSSVIGYQPSLAYFLTLSAGLLATAAVLWWFATVQPQGRQATVLVGVLAVVPLVVVSASLPEHQFVPSASAPYRCADGEVRVCLYPGYDALLGPLHDDLANLISSARAQGVDTRLLPKNFVQDNGGQVPVGVGVISLIGNSPTSGDADPQTVALAVSTPLWCRAMFQSVPPDQLLEDRQLVFDWALVVLGEQRASDFEERHNMPFSDRAVTAAKVDGALSRMLKCAN